MAMDVGQINFTSMFAQKTLLGPLLIIAGVLLGNAGEELGRPKSKIAPLLFAVGWAIFANALSSNAANRNAFSPIQQYLPYVAAAIVVGSVMALKAGGEETNKKPLVGAFIVGWLLFAYSQGLKPNASYFAAFLVFLSMLYFMPKQRELKLVNGWAWPLFVIAFVILIAVNLGVIR